MTDCDWPLCMWIGRGDTCSETTLTGESRFHISTPLGIWTWVPCDGKQTGSPLDQWDMVRMKWDCRLCTGLPPSSRLRWLWSRKGDLQRAWNRDRKAVWDQEGLSHCQHEGLVMVRDEARLRRGHDDQSCRGHQCSETTLTGESWFHISIPLGIWTWVPFDSKQTGSPLDQWDMVRMKWDCRLSTYSYFFFFIDQAYQCPDPYRRSAVLRIQLRTGEILAFKEWPRRIFPWRYSRTRFSASYTPRRHTLTF
jgi:hypothetical protein